MRYGHFDDEHCEYVIERPDTPLPWTNYIGARDYFGVVSNTGGGYSFYSDARLRRILRYRHNNVPTDEGGRYLFIRHDDGDFWSPTWQPVRKALDSYECRHGLGYTTIRSSRRGVRAEVTYFVPLDAPLEIWQVTLGVEDDGRKQEQLTVFSFVEFCLWDALDDQTNFQRNLNTGEVEVEGSIIYHKTEYRERRDHFAFFAADGGSLLGFDTDRDAFLGPYAPLSSPQVVVRGRPGNSIAHGWAPVGSHCLRVTVRPGEPQHLVFVLGIARNRPEDKFEADGRINKAPAREAAARYLSWDAAEASRRELEAYWASVLGRFRATTPDASVVPVVNTWNQYQCMIALSMGRCASYFESGIGRGIAFRDGNQDTLGAVHQSPSAVRERLGDLASLQFAEGSVFHHYSPRGKKGSTDMGRGFNDDPLWLVIATAHYLKETGEWDVLSHPVPFADDPRPVPLEEHLRRSLSFTLSNLGPHGLPLIGEADWNDCLNLNRVTAHGGRVAESVMIAELLVYAAMEMARMMRSRGRAAEAESYAASAREMARAINVHAWDGKWYLRAFDDDGNPVGSSMNREGRIFLETQPWAVMSGVAPERRGILCMDSVWDSLATRHGIVLQRPAFTRYSEKLGACTAYPPGLKENAGILCHPNAWAVVAECVLGRGVRAYSYYKTLLPTTRNEVPDAHRAEPYVYAQTIAGPDCPRFGEAKGSWLTGTASWMFVAASQWILGVRPDYDGLLVDPCIPPGWDGFSVERVFRGELYRITVENPEHVSKGIVHLEMDGREYEPIPAAGELTPEEERAAAGLAGFIPVGSTTAAGRERSGRAHDVRAVMGRPT